MATQLLPPPAAHHELLISKLEAVERGEIRNLMFLLPPGSAKSSYASVLFPAWFVGRNPTLNLLAASHTQELADAFGRKVRNLIASREHQRVFGTALAPDSAAAGRWATTSGGEYFATGIGGAVTGRRGDLGVIDDPVKSREDADSERMRDRAWSWYQSDWLTRMKPGARQICVMTRWHEDDLGGRILDTYGDKWEVVKLPMIAGLNDPLQRLPGQRLWPEWFDDEMIERAQVDTRSWNALYQQEPTAAEGDYFKRQWFNEYDELPGNLRMYGASDYAVTEAGGDYTEHGVFGWDGDVLWVVDWWYGQEQTDVWVEKKIDFIVEHDPLCWFGESGVIKSAIDPYMRRRMAQREAHCRIEYLPSVAAKEIRARSFQALAASGKVMFPKHAPWKAHVLQNLLSFPAGAHDDSVDVCSLIGRGLKLLGNVKKPRKPVLDMYPADWMA